MNGNNVTEQIILSPFSKNALDQANAAAKLKPSALLARRLDLRGKTVFSFAETPDSLTESAFSLYRNGSGWQLGIHVTDVCEYVCEGSPLDIEAARRLATVRNGFVNADMLPEKLSKDICDLSVGKDRLCVSVLLDISDKGELLSVDCEESVVRVAQCCVYKEVDELIFASDASSVFHLRSKYGALFNTLADMYELAALLCNVRRERGGLDCGVFRRVYERNENGKVIAFRRESEPDTRAMVREIGYFFSDAIGNYMYNNKLPCLFLGTYPVPEETLDYLGKLVGETNKDNSPAARTADIADKAKGSPYYSFVCDVLSASLPCPRFSDQPVMSSLCGSDKIISFVHPVSQYGDLIAQRILKTSIAASGKVGNINLNRHRKVVKEAADAANRTAKFIFETKRLYANLAALEYIEHSGETEFVGFPLLKDESGSVPVILDCGVTAVVPSQYSAGFDFDAAKPYKFEIVALGTDSEATVVKPIED